MTYSLVPIVMQIDFINHQEFGIEVSGLKSYLKKLEKAIKTMEGLVNVVFVNDEYIQSLNKAYRGKDVPTDVLSFNYEEQGAGEDLNGEVYISVDTAGRQAKDHGHSLMDEVAKLFVHGLLHIHGYDHVKDDDYKRMFAIEKQLLGKVAGKYIASE